MVQTQSCKKSLNSYFLKKIHLKLMCLSLSFTCVFASAIAHTDSFDEKECSKEVLLAYFPEVIVDETLKRFNVPEDKWQEIKATLTQKDKEIVLIVEKKAAQMAPNPLKDPQQRQLAVKLFRDTLLEVFTEALTTANITDEIQIKNMLEDIQQQKAKRFALCLEKHQKEMEKN